MKITGKLHYKKIGTFPIVETPDLIILTGLNGAGKTQFLRGIEEGKIIIDSVSKYKTVYFDYRSFKVGNDMNFDTYGTKYNLDRETDKFLEKIDAQIRNGSSYKKIRSLAEEIYRESFSYSSFNEIESQLLHAQSHESKKISYLSKGSYSGHGDRELEEELANINIWNNTDIENIKHKTHVLKYRDRIEKEIFNELLSEFKPFTDAVKRSGKVLHVIEKDNVKENYISSLTKDNDISLSLSELSTQYRKNQYIWSHDNWEKSKKSCTVDDLNKEFEKIYEKPWSIMNEIIQKINELSPNKEIFDFEFSAPDDKPLTRKNHESYAFKTTLQLRKKPKNSWRETRELNDLSSGEQTLLALANSILYARDDFTLPSVLLLDEVDASLHPSMSKCLLKTLEEVFVKRGVKVIIATHSPSTVAVAPEDSLYLVDKSSRSPIKNIDKNEAISLLTENIMTLQQGVDILSKTLKERITIFSEGDNVDYIKRFLDINQIANVFIFETIRNKTGKNQLGTIFDLFSSFEHCDQDVIFVLDGDVSGEKINKNKESKNNTHWLVLPKNDSNSLAKKGIENLFPEYLFDGFVTKVEKSTGDIIESFDLSRKKDFLNHVLKNAKSEDYDKFESIIELIHNIRNSIGEG